MGGDHKVFASLFIQVLGLKLSSVTNVKRKVLKGINELFLSPT